MTLPHPFSNELYTLFFEGLDHSSLVNCSYVCRSFRQLSRPFLFREIDIGYDLKKQGGQNRLQNLVDLIQDSDNSILGFIESFSLIIWSSYEWNTKPPAASSRFNSNIIDLLSKAPKLQELSIRASHPQSWSLFENTTQASLRVLFQLPTLRALSLDGFEDLPISIFNKIQVEILAIERCKGTREEDDPDTFQSLRLSELCIDSEMSFLDLYAGATHGESSSAFPNISTLWYESRNSYFQDFILSLDIISQSLEEIHIVAEVDDVILEDGDARLDLSLFTNLKEFEIDYNNYSRNIISFCDAFLRPSAHCGALEELFVTVKVYDTDNDDFNTSPEITHEYWRVLDEALAHSHFSNADIRLVIAYRVEGERHAIRDRQFRENLRNQVLDVFPALTALDAAAVKVEIECWEDGELLANLFEFPSSPEELDVKS